MPKKILDKKEVSSEVGDLSYDTKTLITVITLVTVYPVGLILMLIWMKWKKWIKFLVSLPAIFVLMVPLAVIFFSIMVIVKSGKGLMDFREIGRERWDDRPTIIEMNSSEEATMSPTMKIVKE